jgi:hypothetical protein
VSNGGVSGIGGGVFGEVGGFSGSNFWGVGDVSAWGDYWTTVWGVWDGVVVRMRNFSFFGEMGGFGSSNFWGIGEVSAWGDNWRSVWAVVAIAVVWRSVVVSAFGVFGEVGSLGGGYFWGVSKVTRWSDYWSGVTVDTSFVEWVTSGGMSGKVSGFGGDDFWSFSWYGRRFDNDWRFWYWVESGHYSWYWTGRWADWEIIGSNAVTGGIGDVIGTVYLSVGFYVAEATDFVTSGVLDGIVWLMWFRVAVASLTVTILSVVLSF